jgi:hypothetical protein
MNNEKRAFISVTAQILTAGFENRTCQRTQSKIICERIQRSGAGSEKNMVMFGTVITACSQTILAGVSQLNRLRGFSPFFQAYFGMHKILLPLRLLPSSFLVATIPYNVQNNA